MWSASGHFRPQLPGRSRPSSCRQAESQAQLHGTALPPCPNTWWGGTGRDMGGARGSRAGTCCALIQTQGGRSLAQPRCSVDWGGCGSDSVAHWQDHVGEATRVCVCVRGQGVDPLLHGAVSWNCSKVHLRRRPHPCFLEAPRTRAVTRPALPSVLSRRAGTRGRGCKGEGSVCSREVAHRLCRGVGTAARSPRHQISRTISKAVRSCLNG